MKGSTDPGVRVFVADRRVEVDPNGRFESLAAGATTTDTFTYTVSDGQGGTDTATVSITFSSTVR